MRKASTRLKSILRRAVALLLALALLTPTVFAVKLWPARGDTFGSFVTGSYHRVQIYAEEYGDQELVANRSVYAEKIFYIIEIPELDADTATGDDYTLTLTLVEERGEAPTVKLKPDNYYLPVRVPWTADDGRQCDLYIVAVPEIRDYSAADYSGVYRQYLAIYDELRQLYDTLSAVEVGTVGGYQILAAACLETICYETPGRAFSILNGNRNTEEDFIRDVQAQNVLSPEQMERIYTEVLPYYMDYCRRTIQAPEVTGLRIFGAEAVPSGAGTFLLTLPAGVDRTLAPAYLELDTLGPSTYETRGGWTGAAVRLITYARDPATEVVYDNTEDGVVQEQYVIELAVGDPVFSVRAFQVGDRTATIDETAGTISLHLAQGWPWEQAPAVTASGTSYVYLDAEGAVLTPGEDGVVDLSVAKTLRLTLDLQEYAASGADAESLVFTKDYTLNITQGNSEECDLLSFSLGVDGEQVTWGADNAITVTIPYATDWDDLNPTYTASYDAVVTGPDAPDFEHSGQQPVTYTVTAQDGSNTKTYTVIVRKSPPSTENQITSFRYGSREAVIDHSAGTITLELSAGSSLRLAPTIVVSQFAVVKPASGVVQDFSSPVVYTVTAQDGSPKRYTVTVSVSGEQQENPRQQQLEKLLEAIIEDYRVSASNDWEWMNLGIYDGLDTPNDADGFDIAAQIAEMDLGPTATMTDIDRVVMMLTARGYDCSSLAQYNNGEPFIDKAGNEIDNLVHNMCATPSGGVNGLLFGLIALDMGNYSVPADLEKNRESMLEDLLDMTYPEIVSSIMGLDGAPGLMYAIAPYQDDPVYGDRVKSKLEDGAAYLASQMSSDYTFASWDSVNSEVISWTICALSSSGIDISTDPRFGNGEMSMLTQWLDLFSTADGFKHVTSEFVKNDMATYMGCYALMWYLGFLENGGNGHPYYLWYHVQDFSRAYSTEADILTFELEGRQGVITEGNGTGENTIALTLPTGTPLEQVSPRLTLSSGATLVAPELPTTLTAGVPYPFTVRAEDGVTEKTYYVTVEFSDEIQPSGAELYLDTILLQDANQRELTVIASEITETDDGADVLLTIEAGKNTSSLRLIADISFGAAASPALDGVSVMDLSDWTAFTVNSADGLHQKTYRVKVQSMNQAAISAFSLTINGTTYQGEIDNTANTIAVADVDDSNLTTTWFSPSITLGEGTTICNPLPGTSQNFSAPVTYTVSGSDVVSRTYTVRVTNRSGSLISSSGGGTSTSSRATITAFSVLGVDGEIDQSAGTITVRLPYGTNVSAVIPTVTVPSGAAVSPVSGEVVNLNGTVPYTVTLGAESRTYYVSVIFVYTTSQQLWDELAEEDSVRQHQVSRDPSGLPGGWRYRR